MLTLEAGKFYSTRDGRLVGPLERNPELTRWHFVHRDGKKTREDLPNEWVWMAMLGDTKTWWLANGMAQPSNWPCGRDLFAQAPSALASDYVERMRTFVEEGGQLSHRNGLDLLAEVERSQGHGR